MKEKTHQICIRGLTFWQERYCRFEASWTKASRRKKTGVFIAVYTVLFLVTFLLAYSPFLLEGKSFIWTSDGRTEHYPTLVYTGRYLRQIILNLLKGNFSVPMFDLNIGVGADVIATLNYYGFGDPLHLLAVFVPTKYIEYLYNFIAIFRIYLAGLAFSALCIYHGRRVSFTLIGALIYTFSGYVIGSAIRHPYFISPMIQLPLLLIGIDQIICRKKSFLFILAVFYSALCGFYFLYMMTIMLGIYALIRFFDRYLTNRIKEFAQMVWRIIWAYLLGIGMAAVFFLPGVIGFFYSDRSGAGIVNNYFSYGWSWYRNNLLRLIAPPGSWDNLSLAAVMLLAVVLLFSVRKKRRSLKLLLAVGMCIFLLPLGGYVMNGFGYVSNRWTFGLALLFSYIVVEMMPTLLSLNHRRKLICFGTLLIYVLCVFIGSKNRTIYYVVGVAMLGITLAVLLLVNDADAAKEKPKRKFKALSAAICILLVIGNVSINAVYRFAADQANYISEFTVYGTETERLESALVREAEPYLADQAGRFEGSSSFRNMGMVWRVPTMSSYWNITNSHVTNLWLSLENIQQRASAFNIYGTDQRTIMNALLATKYFIGEKNSSQYVPYGYTLLKETKNENVIYENQYALPWGYTYDSYISYNALSELNGLELEEAMLQTIALDKDVEGVFVGYAESNLQTVPYEIKKMSDLEWEDGVLKVNKANAVMTLEFQLAEQAEGYLRLQGFDINGSGQTDFTVTVKCSGISKGAVAASALNSWYVGRENYLFNLGYSEEERTTCTLTFPVKGTFHLDDIQLYALPMDKYPEQVEALRAEPLKNIEFGTNRITGTVDLSKNKILCMSIPYSAGWTARVDGEKVEILRGNYMFMALPLEAGHHEIEFTYCTPGLRAGLVCCLISAGCLAYLAIQERRKKERLT